MVLFGVPYKVRNDSYNVNVAVPIANEMQGHRRCED